VRNRLNAEADTASSKGAGYTIGAAIDDSLRTARRLAETADKTVMGAVERGVETAYTVIEEYMLRGRETARRFQQGTPGRTDMNEGRQGENRPYENPWLSAQWSAPMSMMMAPWMPMMKMWQESMATFAQGTPMASMAEWMNAFTPGAAYGRSNGTSVIVQVSSQAPAAVTVELDAGAESMKLSAAPLQHASSRSAPALVGIRIDSKDGVARVRITVPTDQPAGLYRGQIQDDTGMRRGQLSLEIESGAPAAAAKKTTRARPRKKA